MQTSGADDLNSHRHLTQLVSREPIVRLHRRVALRNKGLREEDDVAEAVEWVGAERFDLHLDKLVGRHLQDMSEHLPPYALIDRAIVGRVAPA